MPSGMGFRVLNLFCVPGYAVANSLKYAQNPRKYLVAKATLLDVVSLTDSVRSMPSDMGFRVWDLGFRVWGQGLRVEG
jgi:hypothetical protein